MNYKFVLWGYGKRGKRFVDYCPKEHIVAIIDNNEELQGKLVDRIPIVSYKCYKENFKEYDIVIAVDDNIMIQEQLIKEGILNYLLLEDSPPEIMGFGRGRWYDELPIRIEKEKQYYIYGLNLYSILLRQFLLEKYGCEINIIPEKEDKISKKFIDKYTYIVSYERILKNEDTVFLYASRYKNKLAIKNMVDVFDFSSQIDEYRMPKLEKFKNVHYGEKCFVIATGPSLSYDDLNKLQESGIVCFGVNRIYLAYSETVWRPNYLVAIDDKIIREYSDEIKKCEALEKFVSDEVSEFWNENVEDNINKIHNHVLEFYPEFPQFSVDICKCIYSARTVVYACLQIAIYMGFKDIYLLGVDHNYSKNQSDKSNHFHADYYKGRINPDNYFKDKAELAFLAAKEHAEKNGIKIYNATRGGKLEVFEKVDFDTLDFL